jgi:hypothetical protein
MVKTTQFLLFILFLFTECVTTSIVQRFTDTSIKQSNVRACCYLDYSNIMVEHFSDVESVLGPGEKSYLIGSFLSNQIRFSLRDSGDFCDVKRLDSCSTFLDSTVFLRHLPLSIKMPDQKCVKSSGCDIAITISNVVVDDRIHVSFGGGFIIPFAGASRDIVINCTFSIVASGGQLLYAGQIESRTPSEGVRIDINTLYQSVNDLAKNVLKETIYKWVF